MCYKPVSGLRGNPPTIKNPRNVFLSVESQIRYGRKPHPSLQPGFVVGSDSMSRLKGMSSRGMGNKIWDFIGKTVYQVQIRGKSKVGFPKSNIVFFLNTSAIRNNFHGIFLLYHLTPSLSEPFKWAWSSTLGRARQNPSMLSTRTLHFRAMFLWKWWWWWKYVP